MITDPVNLGFVLKRYYSDRLYYTKEEFTAAVWSVFTLQWPAIAWCALVGRE